MAEPLVVLRADELDERIAAAVVRALEGFRPTAEPQAMLDRVGLAKALSVCPSTVDRLRGDGMPTLWIGDSPRFELDAVKRWLADRKQPAREAGSRQARKPENKAEERAEACTSSKALSAKPQKAHVLRNGAGGSP